MIFSTNPFLALVAQAQEGEDDDDSGEEPTSTPSAIIENASILHSQASHIVKMTIKSQLQEMYLISLQISPLLM
jgi:hypothetical protein